MVEGVERVCVAKKRVTSNVYVIVKITIPSVTTTSFRTECDMFFFQKTKLSAKNLAENNVFTYYVI